MFCILKVHLVFIDETITRWCMIRSLFSVWHAWWIDRSVSERLKVGCRSRISASRAPLARPIAHLSCTRFSEQLRFASLHQGLRRRADSSPLALFSICICYVCFWPCWPRSGRGSGASLPLSALIWYDISELGWSKPGGGRGPRCIAEGPVRGLGCSIKIPCDHFWLNQAASFSDFFFLSFI